MDHQAHHQQQVYYQDNIGNTGNPPHDQNNGSFAADHTAVVDGQQNKYGQYSHTQPQLDKSNSHDSKPSHNNYMQNDKQLGADPNNQRPATYGGPSQTSAPQVQNHQYSAHFTGATSSDPQVQKKPQEMSALDRLKTIQSNFKRTWNGINCEYSGRSGTSNFVNKKRIFHIGETYYEEEDRQRQLAKVFSKLKELEEDKMNISTAQSSTTSFNKTTTSTSGAGFFSSQPSSTASQFYNNQNKNQSDFIPFKNINSTQLISHPQSHNGYQKGYHIENSELLYKMLRFDNKLVRSMLENNSFTHTESHEWNVLWSSSSCKSYLYEGLNEYQKINHFPQSYEITRKDRLCFNMVRMQERFGKQNFDFVPDTYILPDEFGDFYAHYQKLKQHDSKKNVWIVKPANSSQGKGIYIVDDINDVNVDDTSVISRYVTNPLLINGHKFDLRIYVLVTSYEPMKVYVFQEGLARFASETYTSKINKHNRYMHLTNYSVNKKNDNFVQNENAEQDDFGFKWSLGAFCKHLEQVGIDMNLLWSRIYDVILKTLICGEHHVQAAMKKNGTHRTNCFELLGFDVLIDSDLKPWLLEVNLSPSLATDAPLDMTIKSTLLSDVFNLVGVKRFDRKKESLNKIKHRMKGMYNKGPKKTGLGGGIQGTSLQNNNVGQSEVYHQQTNQAFNQTIDKFVNENQMDFAHLHDSMKKGATLRYREYVRETLAENLRKGNFIRIYPAKNSDIYDCFFNGPRPYNKVVYKALFTDEIMKTTQVKPSADMKLGYKMEIPPTSYDQYKRQQQDRIQTQQPREERKQIMEANNEVQPNPAPVKTVKKPQGQATPKERAVTSSQSVSQNVSQHQNPSSLNSSLAQSTKPQSSSASSQQQVPQNNTQDTKQQEKVLITGDDILIEYVERLMGAINNVPDEQLQDNWKNALEKFITHYVWHSQDRRSDGAENFRVAQNSPFWFRLEGRLNEMQERRRRLIKYLYKKEGKLQDFEEGFKQSINKKTTIIKKFSSAQLEDLLRTSTKNVAQEVVSSLIPPQGGIGVLADIDRVLGNRDDGSSNRRKTAVMVKKPSQYNNELDEASEGYDASNDHSTRGGNGRQSKSANAARSMTRKNQQQLQSEEVFPNSSVTRQSNVLQSTTNTTSSRPINTRAGVNMNNSATRANDQQNLTDMISKREISSNYIKRILDNQAVLK